MPQQIRDERHGRCGELDGNATNNRRMHVAVRQGPYPSMPRRVGQNSRASSFPASAVESPCIKSRLLQQLLTLVPADDLRNRHGQPIGDSGGKQSGTT
jgi:hypothetical protein